MKKRDVQQVVEANIEAMKTMLGLDRWEIDIKYGKTKANVLGKGFVGQCTTDVTWINEAIITLDPKMLDDKTEVLDILQHELVHCITSNFHLGMTTTAKLVSKKEYQALLVLNYRADEEVTKWICKILDSLKPFPAQEGCLFCSSKNSPDNVLAPIYICCTCGQKMIDRLETNSSKKKSQDQKKG